MSAPSEEGASADEQLRQRFAGRPIRKMGSGKPPNAPRFISTGVPALEQALGAHRLRGGEVLEVCGDDSDAQMMLICHLLAAAQLRDGVCACIDVAGTFPVAHAVRLGVAVDDLLGSREVHGEDLLAIFAELAGSGALDVLVLNSVPALTPKLVMEGTVGSGDPGLFGQMLSKGMRDLGLAMDDSRSLCLLVNQHDGRRWDAATRRWSTVRPSAATLDRCVTRRLELRQLTKQADRIADPDHWRSRLRVIERGAPEAAIELDLELEYGTGITSAVSPE